MPTPLKLQGQPAEVRQCQQVAVEAKLEQQPDRLQALELVKLASKVVGVTYWRLLSQGQLPQVDAHRTKCLHLY